MLTGESGSGKSVFLYKIMDLYVRSSRPCIYVALDESPSQLRKSLANFIGEMEQKERDGLLTFVDCYSCMGGLASQEKYHLDSPNDLSGLAVLVSKLAADLGTQAPVRLFIDSATAMFAHCESNAILKFLYSTSVRLKSHGGSLFFTLNGGAVTTEIQKRLEQLADGVAEVQAQETPGMTKRYYRFSKVRGKMYFDNWLPFIVGERAIWLGPPEDAETREKFYKVFELITSG